MALSSAEDTSALLADDIADIEFPPSDLLSDEPPLETDFHRDQIDLLIRLLKWWWREREDFYVSGNLTIYYNERQLKSRDFRGPDFFVVLGTQKKDRKSWIVWHEEGQYPNVIVEILSDKTAVVDKGLKKQLYQDTFRTPEYFWFDPVSLGFKGFHLQNGQYEEIAPTQEGRLWSRQLELYLGVHERKLRLFTADNILIPSPEERVEEMEQTIERLREQLRSQGIEPES
ncbi:Uma2 family endonuclease [Gloeocapsopsis sp. IPPAS B-1203]|uniref:Uma2 family endonuclease n=1 Tax=Gloeocapsopsis sp. IPPAS B-1203 TaxID=2049454 RepID=UPI0025A06EAB|nr:Uma2 family endonuclease [Gloeocapsopsis sp. IPPAS B-1203]